MTQKEFDISPLRCYTVIVKTIRGGREMSIKSVLPRVYLAGKRQRITVRATDTVTPEIKVQPMEIYSTRHERPQRIDEEYRYDYLPMTPEGDGLWSFEYDFPGEQKYSVKIKVGERVKFNGYIFAVSEELAALRAYKGETHTHTCRSDGKEPPFETAVAYYGAGYDFVSITDHHKYAPSLEARDMLAPLTDRLTVIPGEEVHNKDMAYFHVVNLGGASSVNDIIKTDDAYVDGELDRIINSRTFPDGVDPNTAAYRIFISEHIRRAGGVSILAHPFWDAYGEYNMERRELEYHLTNKTFDALELFAGNDNNGNGDNLEIAVWGEIRATGTRVSLLGASDNHNRHSTVTRFNKNLSVVFARGTDDILDAVRRGDTVAVKRTDDEKFLVLGDYRLVNYARFLLAEFYPEYSALCSVAAEAILESPDERSNALAEAEEKIAQFRASFFADGVAGKA